MFLLYEIATGIPRATVTSAPIAESNVNEGEAILEIPPETQITELTRVVDGKLVVIDPPAIDAVHAARHLRQGGLLESDWTQTLDSPLNDEKKAEWAAYRKLLRDFPATIQSLLDDPEIDASQIDFSYIEDRLPNPPVDAE